MTSRFNQSGAVILEVARAVGLQRTLGRQDALEHISRMSSSAQAIVKAAVGAASLGNVAWAAALAEMRQASQDFLARLDGRSAIQGMLGSGVISRAPANVPLLTILQAAEAAEVGEGLPRPVSRMVLSLEEKLILKKIQSTVVCSKDLLDQAASAQAFLSRALRSAVATAIDKVLIPQLLQGAAVIPSVGNRTDDLAAILDAVNNDGAATLAWVASVGVANKLALSDVTGQAAPTGQSMFLGSPLFVSGAMAEGTLALVNGDQVVGDLEGFGLESSDQTTLNMDDAPTVPNSVVPTGASGMVNMWQTNSIALGMTALGGVQSVVGAVAMLENIDWGTTP